MWSDSHHIIYNQTWEDPFVDFKGLKPTNRDIFVCIISGGCNILNLSLHKPNIIYAIDANFAQYALLKLKMAAIAGLNYSQFWTLFGNAVSEHNLVIYNKLIRKLLNPVEKNFWDKHIKLFVSGFYQVGKLKTLHILRNWIAWSCGKENLKEFVGAKNIQIQKSIYLEKIKSLLWNRITRHVPLITMYLYGVSFRQIQRCLAAGQFFLKDIFTVRLDQLFSTVYIGKNYFWQRIFLGKYKSRSCCPPYLQKKYFVKLKRSVNKISPQNLSIIEFLRTLADSFVTKFNLSDVPEFLNYKDQLILWAEVVRTGKNKALILYRSFSPNFFIPEVFLSNLTYLKVISAKLTQKEMTGSYAAVYVYQLHKQN